MTYTHYDYLDLAPGASSARIEAAYAAVLERFQYGATDASQDMSGLVRMIHAAYEVLSSPVIGADGTVYFGSADNCLYAVSPNGSQKWRYATIGAVVSSAAICSDGTVLAGSVDSWVYAVTSGGSTEWRFPADDCLYASIAVGADGTIYAVSCDGFLYAINGSSQLAGAPWSKFHHDRRNTGSVTGGH